MTKTVATRLLAVVAIVAGASATASAVLSASSGASARAVDYIAVTSSRGFAHGSDSKLQSVLASAGLRTAVLGAGSVDFVLQRRRTKTIRAAPKAAGFPMVFATIDPGVAGSTLSAVVRKQLVLGRVVMGATSSKVERAKVGDTFTLLGWNGRQVEVRVGAVVADRVVGRAELIIPQSVATSLALVRPYAVRIWGPPDLRARLSATRTAIRSAVDQPVTVDASWQRASGETLTQAQTKLLLGEFSVTRGPGGGVRITAPWTTNNLAWFDLPLVGRVRCNVVVGVAATAALTEIESQGLGHLVNGADSRRNGGCFSPRVARAPTGTSGRTLSRHVWGQAVDINPSANPYGGPARMDPRIVTIFKKYGFVWGGRFLVPDPMHFEFTARTA